MAKALTKTPIDFSETPTGFRWYTVVTRFNYEQKFMHDFLEGLEAHNFLDLVEDIFIPAKEYSLEYENSKGKKVYRNVTDKVISLYVFIKAKMTDRLYWYMRNTAGCATVLATGGALNILSDEEVYKIRTDCIVKEKVIKDMKVSSSKDPFFNPMTELNPAMKKLLEQGIGNDDDNNQVDYSSYTGEEDNTIREDEDDEFLKYEEYNSDDAHEEKIKRRKDSLY